MTARGAMVPGNAWGAGPPNGGAALTIILFFGIGELDELLTWSVLGLDKQIYHPACPGSTLRNAKSASRRTVVTSRVEPGCAGRKQMAAWNLPAAVQRHPKCCIAPRGQEA
jgi:hypothetical protein